MTTTPPLTRTAYRTCPLCEATCGLELTLEGERVVRVRGDDDDVFSRGYICPKGVALGELHHDPDRLRRPLLKRGGDFQEVGWDEAFAGVAERLAKIQKAHGKNAVAIYLGNPNVHNLAGSFYARPLVKALRTKNVFTASTVDQIPKHVSSALLFGHPRHIPVPDLDRTDFLLMLGANPLASNGSLCTAPDFPGRLRALRKRGGHLVVVDPRRTETAKKADEHVFIRPGTDPLLLFAIVHTLFQEGWVDLGRLEGLVQGVDEMRRLAQPFAPSEVSGRCGVCQIDIRDLARRLAQADRAVVYGRLGTTAAPFGTLASWLVDVVNILTGNLDTPGGAMFARPVHEAYRPDGKPGGRGYQLGRWRSRVRDLPEFMGELPVATLADEIETPGEGQVRALITVAGNPVLSTPNSARLERALQSLELMVSVDPYRNETTRLADVILPPPSPLHRGHCDLAFYQLSVRNVVNYSPPVFPLDGGALDEWEILARLALIAGGQGPEAPVELLDEMVIRSVVQRELGSAGSPLKGLASADVLKMLEPVRGPERILDFLLRAGAYGDHFGRRPDGLTLAALSAEPHGVDLGPLEPRLPELLRTPSGQIELAPGPIAREVDRLRDFLDYGPNGGTGTGWVLIGRRHLLSNNSWMHNQPSLMRGGERCTLLVHPDDAVRLGLAVGDRVRIRSAAGSLTAPVELTDHIMPGVVSLPHGWGHHLDGSGQRVAMAHPGVNSNRLTDETQVDYLSGNAVLNGIPVTIEPV